MNTTKNTIATKKVSTAKTAKVRTPRVKKSETTVVVEQIENAIPSKINKIVLNKIQKAMKMLTKVSGTSQENVVAFLIKNLASQKSKVKISEHLTKLVLKIASGTLEIPTLDKTPASEVFVDQMVAQFGFNKSQLENFIINELSTKKVVVLNTFFKDMFFKASTNPTFVAKIQSFKRF